MRSKSICGMSSDVKEWMSTVYFATSMPLRLFGDKPKKAMACEQRQARIGPRV